jgi:dipeptidyl-peptidase-4
MAQEQQLRTFTLEDLNFGGNNYRNMVPQMRYTAWWGDRLVSLDDEQCSLVDGNGRETTLFTSNRCSSPPEATTTAA